MAGRDSNARSVDLHFAGPIAGEDHLVDAHVGLLLESRLPRPGVIGKHRRVSRWRAGSLARWRAGLQLVQIALRHHPFLTTVFVVLAAVDAAVGPATALVTGGIVNTVENHGPPGSLTRLLVGFAALTIAPIAVTRWRGALDLDHRVGNVLDRRVTAAFLAPAGVDHLDDPRVRDAADRAATTWNSSLFEGLLSVVMNRVTGIIATVMLGATGGWGLAAVVAVVWLVAGRWTWRQSAQSLDVMFEKSPALRDADYTAEFTISNDSAKELRVFGAAPWLIDRYTRTWTEAMSPLWDRRRGDIPASAAVALAVALANGGALAWLVLSAVEGHLSIASLTVSVQALLQMAALGNLAYGHWEVEYGLRTVPANDELVRLVSAPRFRLEGTLPAAGMPNTGITFEDVCYTYPGSGREVLSGVNLEIVAGSSLAIVGENGAGKTTLVKLLCRFADPTSGRIVVDGIPLKDIDASGWHDRLAGLFQDFIRYPLPARHNIALGRTVDERVLRDAAEAASVAGVLDSLPHGWDTTLGRRFGGSELSGGQWQRVALARALVGLRCGAGVLVLDEPTAQLDARAEADLYDQFLELTRGVTTILISHRFSTVRRASHIAVLKGGRIVEYGTHEQLMDLAGRYAHMFSLQADRFTTTDSP